jgi:hypothetical protein
LMVLSSDRVSCLLSSQSSLVDTGLSSRETDHQSDHWLLHAADAYLYRGEMDPGWRDTSGSRKVILGLAYWAEAGVTALPTRSTRPTARARMFGS